MTKSIDNTTSVKLQLGNGYLLDFDQLARLLNAAVQDDRGKIPQSDLAAAVGVADRKVENLGSLANAVGLVRRRTYKPTELGLLLQKADPFFDAIGTLWFMHYIISSESRNLVWNRIVNQVLPTQSRFTRDSLRAAFDDLRLYYSEDSIKDHLREEVKTFLDAYINQSFSRLAFLRVDGENYALAYRQPVPALVLAAAIARFRVTCCSGDTVIPIRDLCGAPNSPGVVFALPEERLRALLEELKNQPGFSLESRADLDQVRMPVDLSDVDWMRRYYEQR